MANHEDLYAQLRATILARHFALGRFSRANHFTSRNELGARDSHPVGGQTRIRFDCQKHWVRPTDATGELIYDDAEHFPSLAEPSQTIERWRVMRHDRSNALLMTGMRLISLAVEHKLGSQTALPVIKLVVETLRSLFKIADQTNPFAGYILRWDPSTTDEWQVDLDAKGTETPIVCCQFLVNPRNFKEQHYLYCTPLDDPRYRSAKALNQHDRFRRWEPSMDEYVGLVTGYFIVWHVLKDDASPDARGTLAEVRRQARIVGRYLAHVGYLLVRPCGGFARAGAAGINPVLEVPFKRIFSRITGDSEDNFTAKATFQDAIRMAGLWPCYSQGLPGSLAVAGAIGGVIEQFKKSLAWSKFTALFGSDPVGRLHTLLMKSGLSDAQARVTLTNLAAEIQHVTDRRECFDVADQQTQDEFGLGLAMKQLPPQLGFQAWMPNVEQGWSEIFKPLLGLTALEDSDTTVKSAYLKWYESSSKQVNGPDENEILGNERFTTLPTAVAALLLGDPAAKSTSSQRTAAEARLRDELTIMHDTLRFELNLKPPVSNDTYNTNEAGPGFPNNDVPYVCEWHDKVNDYFGYMVPLSVAWLHASRQTASPFPDIPNPTASSMAGWQHALVPGVVIDAAIGGMLVIPINKIQNDVTPMSGYGSMDVLQDPPPKGDDNLIGKEAVSQPGPVTAVELHQGVFPSPILIPWQKTSQSFEIPIPNLPAGRSSSDFSALLLINASQQVNITNQSLTTSSDHITLTVEVQTIVVTNKSTHPPTVTLVGGWFKADCSVVWVPKQ